MDALIAARPDNPSWRYERSMILRKVAEVKIAEGKPEVALATLRRGLCRSRRLAEGRPASFDRQMTILRTHQGDPRELADLAVAHRQLAALGDRPVERLEAALGIFEALAGQGLLDPDNLKGLDAARGELDAARKAAAPK